MTNQILKTVKSVKLIALFLLSFAFLFGSAVYAQEKNKSTITVTVAGLKTDEGDVKIDVFNNEEGWLKKSVYSSAAKIQDKKCECTFENIPYGDYAIFVYQDKNSNDELDAINDMFPTEPFGYSRVTQMVMGPARWDDVKISISSPKMEMEIMVLEIPPSFLESMKNQEKQ